MKVIMRHFSSTENEVQLHSIAKLNERPRIVGVGEADCIPQIRPSDLKKWERMVRPWFSVSLISFSSVGRSTNGIKKYFLSGAQLLKGSCYRPSSYWMPFMCVSTGFYHLIWDHLSFIIQTSIWMLMRLFLWDFFVWGEIILMTLRNMRLHFLLVSIHFCRVLPNIQSKL